MPDSIKAVLIDLPANDAIVVMEGAGHYWGMKPYAGGGQVRPVAFDDADTSPTTPIDLAVSVGGQAVGEQFATPVRVQNGIVLQNLPNTGVAGLVVVWYEPDEDLV